MDLSSVFASLDPIQKAFTAAGAAFGALGAFLALYKIPSDLRLNRTAQRKQIAELFQETTGFLKDRSAAHPLSVQAKFLAATGSSTKWSPGGEEILDFLENTELSTQFNALEFADCSEFVCYSKLDENFKPRGAWTQGMLRRHWWGEFTIYMICGVFGFVVAASPEIGPMRFLFALPAFVYAIPKASQSNILGRARKMLQRTSKKAETQKASKQKDEAAKPETSLPLTKS